MEYFKSFLNYFQIFIIIGALYLVFSYDPIICSQRIHVAGVLLLFTYLETVREMGTHPKRAHVIQMFLKVTKTFFTYLLWYVFLILSCGLSFFIIFGASDNTYADWKQVALKVFVMFIGEIEFSDMPIASLKNPEGIFNYLSEFILLMFFLIVTTVTNIISNGGDLDESSQWPGSF